MKAVQAGVVTMRAGASGRLLSRMYDGEHRADALFRLSQAEAEQLHAELRYVLDEGEAPACRPAAARWP